jgi:adenylate cyclase
MWVLIVRSTDGKPKEYRVKSAKATIGRQQDNDIVIYDLSASRTHAALEYDEISDQLVIRDLGSTNGTYVNQERILKPQVLQPNDIIRIGDHVFDVSQIAGESIEPALVRPKGTQTLTRELVIESIDKHAVLMYDVASKLNTVMDIETALQEVSKMVRIAMGADKCEVLLAEDFDRMGELGFPKSIAQMAIDRRSAVILPDVPADEEQFSKSVVQLHVVSALCVPVISGDQLFGLIYMYKTDLTAKPFDEGDLQLAVAISHQAALTIQRMKLLERVKDEQRIRQLLERFVSPAEAELIFESFVADSTLPGLAEHKITVLFADIADSTGLAERLGPTKFGELLTRYYMDVAEIVFEHNGMIDKFSGDGLLAVFGMTGDRSKHEERAVMAGLDILTQIEVINLEIEQDITVGIGINTGDVVAGYVDTKQRIEFAVLGDTVNVAAGLEKKARPNKLLIGPATVAAVVDAFETHRVGSISVKGRVHDIQAYEVIPQESDVLSPR